MIDTLRENNRSYGIDVLRCAFVLFVLCSHLITWTAYSQGLDAINAYLLAAIKGIILVFQPCGETNPAVLGFIVLSGYCIHRGGLRRNEYNIKSYFIRRAFRIYPIYFLAILTGLVFFSLGSYISSEITSALSGTHNLEWRYILAKVIGISAFFAYA